MSFDGIMCLYQSSTVTVRTITINFVLCVVLSIGFDVHQKELPRG